MRSLVLFFLVAISFDVGVGRDDGTARFTENPEYRLMSGLPIPLIGYGIGNLPHDDIPRVVAAQLRAGVFLIDTAHASRNEHLIAKALAEHDGDGEPRARTRGIGAGPAAAADPTDLAPLHVVTKVWYTHLGYARTTLSIRESLANLRSASPRQIYVHMLIHWPRCSDEVEWMHCAEEEERLPQNVKDAGPPPHLEKEQAFKDSWRAMEDVYLEHQQTHVARKTQEDKFPEHQKKSRAGKEVTPIIASIGVSNFELEDLKELMTLRHPPQIYQGGSWSAFNDPYLMDYIREHRIFYQSYGVMSGIRQQQDSAPNAYRALSIVAEDLLAEEQAEDPDAVIAEATVILAYFLRKGVGVVPRAAATSHQSENSPRAVAAALRHLTPPHIEQLERALPALLKGEDLQLAASFTNALKVPIQLHWVHPDTQEEHLVSEVIEPGSVQVHSTHPGHKFVAYDPVTAMRREFLVNAGYGEIQSFAVEL